MSLGLSEQPISCSIFRARLGFSGGSATAESWKTCGLSGRSRSLVLQNVLKKTKWRYPGYPSGILHLPPILGLPWFFSAGLWSKAGFWGSTSRWTWTHTPSPPFYRSGKNFLRRISMLCYVQTHPNPLSIGSIPAADTVDGYSLVI